MPPRKYDLAAFNTNRADAFKVLWGAFLLTRRPAAAEVNTSHLQLPRCPKQPQPTGNQQQAANGRHSAHLGDARKAERIERAAKDQNAPQKIRPGRV